MSHESDSPTETAAALGEHTSNVSQAHHDATSDRSLVATVLDALEDASDRPADEMSVRLYDSVDPDALDALFEPTRRGARRDEGRVSFAVGEFAVTVHADGRVFVRRVV
ncbi:hypothetical protein NGM10_07790 [Halorussus salilacus]|uniref:HalOD1 output domain-containing protein n=1 Tax=Halorussus salilacus TaxID=2953750 RepID=UPI00209EB082|nr:HalOD1 output domain-containing protein [Halorussus salilacus]USZ69620.1 hypothetical protein NGM10_07790 [Halorussus salilacus]